MKRKIPQDNETEAPKDRVHFDQLDHVQCCYKNDAQTRTVAKMVPLSHHLKGGDNSNKHCFGTKPKLFRESVDFSGNQDTWKFFRETRDNSGTLQKKIGTSSNFISRFYL